MYVWHFKLLLIGSGKMLGTLMPKPTGGDLSAGLISTARPMMPVMMLD